MSSFYLLASCAIMPLCKRGKLVLHNFHVAAGAPPRQLATLYNDINGCFSLPGLENYLLITTNWAAVEVLKMSYL